MIEETMLDQQKLKPKSGETFDLIILGAGPAGMSAAICAARAQLKILVIEKALPGGETASAYIVDNYLGYPNGILGEKLASEMETHMSNYPIYYTCESGEAISNLSDQEKVVFTDLGNNYKTKAIIIATGLQPKKFNTEFEQRFTGRGISYYAKCDVDYYRGADVAVVGGGNCACYAADYLAGFVHKVYLIHHSREIKAVKTLKEKVLGTPNIIPLWDSQVTDAFGLNRLEKIKAVNLSSGQTTWLDVKGIFVYLGRTPSSPPLNPDIRLDESGYIITDEYMRTNLQGIYAAGDLRAKQIRQISTAVADGMIAAINAERGLQR